MNGGERYDEESLRGEEKVGLVMARVWEHEGWVDVSSNLRIRQPSLVYGTVDVWQNIDLQRWVLYFISSAGFSVSSFSCCDRDCQ